jgi:4-diphosphocytidyl-2-C-methyl-D-erythritol kinase
MPTSLRNCPAPAKLNLFLHVVGRRPDGYHLLQTAFQLIDHGDLLHFTLRDDDRIVRTTELAGVPEESDLIVRAARLLQTAATAKFPGKVFGADIAIDKQLPMGGGLGGGSSDAATTLMALDHLWQTGLTRQELMALGLQLGADVPFFIFGRNAFAEGIGEQMQAIDTPPTWFVVIEPGVSVPTARIFSSPELTRDSKPVRITDFSRAIAGYGKNDLQVVACKLFPPIAEAVEWLGHYGDARMTGSGACVFCGFAQESKADEVLESVPAYWKAWKAKALARHPLVDLQKS